MKKSRIHPRTLAASCALLGAAASTVAQTTPESIVLPQGSPPTQPQSTVPAPIGPIPGMDDPLFSSPKLSSIQSLAIGQPITIQTAVAIALVTNRSYATAAAAVLSAQGRTREAQAAMNPQFALNGTLTEYTMAQTAAFGMESLTLTNQFSDVFAPTITLPIDLFGDLRAAVSQSQFQAVSAKIDVNRVRNGLVFDVRNTFYAALRAQGQLVVAQHNLMNSQVRTSDVKKRLAVGRASRFDLITTQADEAQAEQMVVNARGQVTMALGTLKSVMGIDISTPIRLTDDGAVEQPPGVVPVSVPPAQSSTDTNTVSPSSLIVPQTPQPVESFHTVQDEVDLGSDYISAVREAVSTRPEILETDAQISAARKGIVLARRSLNPSLTLSAGYVYQPNAAGFTPSKIGSVALSFSVPFYDGGLSSARREEAQGTLASAEESRRNAVDTVTLDVQQAYVNLVQARARVQVAEVQYAQAEEAFRLARVRYNEGETATAGISPQLEVSNSQNSLTNAESTRLNALYDYNVARTQLDRAIGRYSYGPGAGFMNKPASRQTGS